MPSDKELKVDMTIVRIDPDAQCRAYAYVCRRLSDTPQLREDGLVISDRQLAIEALGLSDCRPLASLDISDLLDMV